MGHSFSGELLGTRDKRGVVHLQTAHWRCGFLKTWFIGVWFTEDMAYCRRDFTEDMAHWRRGLPKTWLIVGVVYRKHGSLEAWYFEDMAHWGRGLSKT